MVYLQTLYKLVWKLYRWGWGSLDELDMMKSTHETFINRKFSNRFLFFFSRKREMREGQEGKTDIKYSILDEMHDKFCYKQWGNVTMWQSDKYFVYQININWGKTS